jgi:hypothetical protein
VNSDTLATCAYRAWQSYWKLRTLVYWSLGTIDPKRFTREV